MSISSLLRAFTVSVLSLVSIQVGTAATDGSVGSPSSGIESMSDQIRAGIEAVVHIVSPRLDASVESYLRTYIEKNRTKTENILGRASMYFPMFEQRLEAAGLPGDLKYLAVVESALTPQAISRVGATGLWQFMRATGREYGLNITKYVDDRCDPVMSTQAAITYLGNLYAQFDSWELAMAAYNAGPGRVRYAIRKSGSRDYWKIQSYLPRETRSYVPGFIAASYILNYYKDHGLEPVTLSEDLMNTESIAVYENLSFSNIQQVTGVPYDVISALNPKYIRSVIPQSVGGHLLVLPSLAAGIMRSFLASDRDPNDPSGFTFDGIETGVELEYVNKLVERIYFVESGDNLYNLARQNNCSVNELMKWNGLSSSNLRIGQRLKIKSMERVLVRVPVAEVVPPAPAAREHFTVVSLPGSIATCTAFASSKSGTTCKPQPALKSVNEISDETVILRRRMSAREMGVTVPAERVNMLVPGTRLN